MEVSCAELDEWQGRIIEIAEEKDEQKRWAMQDSLIADIEFLKIDNEKELHEEHPERCPCRRRNEPCTCEEISQQALEELTTCGDNNEA
jgi:hypothetical protein